MIDMVFFFLSFLKIAFFFVFDSWAFLTPGKEKEIINLGWGEPKLIISFSFPGVKKRQQLDKLDFV